MLAWRGATITAMIRASLVWPSLIVAAILATPTTAAEWIIEGRVVGIADGDTFTILDGANAQRIVRFAGSDSPEKRQPFHRASGDSLAMLVFGLHVEARCYKVDRWYRDVCRVYEGGTDVGLEQVRAGLAWHATPYLREQAPQEREEYAGAEEGARASRRGLWVDPNPIPPWEWRKLERAAR
jgi:endonuclease YncB( thermonuclease family)